MTGEIRKDLLDSLAKPPPAPSELDELMSRDPLSMTKSDIDKIIAYNRQDRARRAEAPKGKKKDLKDMTGQALDLSALGLVVKPKAPTPTPTSGSGFRRM